MDACPDVFLSGWLIPPWRDARLDFAKIFSSLDGHQLIFRKGIVPMATENDLVLVYLEDKPLFFARIENISPDVKPDWYHIKLLVLQMPLQVVTWILRDVYINGETFTMGGKKMRMERVVSPVESEKKEDAKSETTTKPSEATTGANVISFSDLKKE